jgi:serine O-acetyltransferase
MLRVLLRAALDDVRTVQREDPAARSVPEVALLYPGLHAVWTHRVSHTLWGLGLTAPARALSQAARLLTNIEIHPGATLGPRLFIDHGAGVVIGETAEVGSDVTIYHGVTLGGTSLDPVKRHPTVGDRVIIGAGAKLLGAIEIGDDSRVGANAVLVKSVGPQSVVVGVPGQVVAGPSAPAKQEPEPDPLAFAVRSLLRRVERLEDRADSTWVEPALYREDGVWEVTDYVI